MRENELTQLVRALARIQLTESEKAFMRSNLLTYMKLKPAHSADPQPALASFSIFSIKPLFSRAVPVALVAVLVATSVTFAAGDALPGEVLYGIKVNVIEKVRTAVAVSSEAEVKVQAELAAKRLREAEQLTVRGELNTETKTQIEEKFKEHTEKVASNLEAIEEASGAEAVEKVSAEVGGSLQAHSDILEKLSESQDPVTKSDLAILVGEVRQFVKKVGAPGEKVEIQITNETNPDEARRVVDAKEVAARTALNETRNFFEAKKDVFTANTQGEIVAKLELAEKTMTAGSERVSEKKLVDAYRYFKDAQNMAHEAAVMMEVAIELNLEIDIEDGEATTTPDTLPPDEEGSDTGTSTDESNGNSTQGTFDAVSDAVRNLGR